MWKVGQTVWDAALGKGLVVEYTPNGSRRPLTVRFPVKEGETYTWLYTEDGRAKESWNRTLFFSEPKVEGATKPPFVPTLKRGDKIFVVCKDDDEVTRWTVTGEDEYHIYAEGVLTGISVTLRKKDFIVYKTGEPLY